jgi:hypothetical protein
MKRSGVICTRIRVHGRRRVLINSLNSRGGIENAPTKSSAAMERKDKDLIFFSEHVFISLAGCRLKSRTGMAQVRCHIGKCKCIQMQSRGVFFCVYTYALGAISYHFLRLKQENSSFVLCIHGIIYLFLSEWEEIPFLAPAAHKFQSKLRKNKREGGYGYMYMAWLPGYFIHPLVSITHGVWVI